MASPSQLEREKEGTPRVKPATWSSSRVRLAYWARRGERPSPSGEWGPGTGVVSWPAARMRRPTADRRSLSRKTATSMALQGFASSRAASAMSAAAGLMRAHIARWAVDGVGGRWLRVLIGRVRRLRGFRGAEGVSVVTRRPASYVAVP